MLLQVCCIIIVEKVFEEKVVLFVSCELEHTSFMGQKGLLESMAMIKVKRASCKDVRPK